jgi:RNA exonuclease 4
VVKYRKLPKHVTQNDIIATDVNKQAGSNDSVLEDYGSSKIWFDDVDDILIEPPHPQTPGPTGPLKVRSLTNPLIKPDSFQGPTKAVAMDCEMVGVGYGGKDSILARVSVVNQYGQCIYDKYCKPTEKVTDYRTSVSGIRPSDLTSGAAVDLKLIQKEVSDMLEGRILVGHAIHHDLKVLFLDHPKKSIRDTSRYKPFRALSGGGTPSLKKLAQQLLGVQVQEGEHNSIQDAQAAMRLYTLHRIKWERSIQVDGARAVNAPLTKQNARRIKKKRKAEKL